MGKKAQRRRMDQAKRTQPWGTPSPPLPVSDAAVFDDDGIRVYESDAPSEMPKPVQFKLDGVVYTCRELGPLELSEIARMHNRPADSPESIAFMAELFETLLGPGMYREFRTHAGQYQTQPGKFVAIIQGVFQDFAERRSGEESDSSDGPPTIQNGSEDDSSLQAMRILEGRPDLQMAIIQAQEAREREQADNTRPVRMGPGERPPMRNRLSWD